MALVKKGGHKLEEALETGKKDAHIHVIKGRSPEGEVRLRRNIPKQEVRVTVKTDLGQQLVAKSFRGIKLAQINTIVVLRDRKQHAAIELFETYSRIVWEAIRLQAEAELAEVKRQIEQETKDDQTGLGIALESVQGTNEVELGIQITSEVAGYVLNAMLMVDRLIATWIQANLLAIKSGQELSAFISRKRAELEKARKQTHAFMKRLRSLKKDDPTRLRELRLEYLPEELMASVREARREKRRASALDQVKQLADAPRRVGRMTLDDLDAELSQQQ